MKKNFAIALISVVFLALALEAGIRLYDLTKGLSLATHNNLELLYVPSAYYNYGYRPLSDVTYNRKKKEKMRINSMGLRGKEFSISDRSTYRIMCLGGSSTIGNGISDNDHTWPAQLEKLLSDRYPDKKIEVVNAGGFAYTSYELLPKYLFKLSNYSPDMLIFYGTYNDANFIGKLSPTLDIDRLRGGMHRNIMHRFMCHSALYSVLRSRLYPSRFVPREYMKINRRYVDFGLNNFERNLDSLIARAMKDGVKVILCTQALWFDRVKRERHIMEEDRKLFIDICEGCTGIIRKLALVNDLVLVENSDLFNGDWNKFMINTVHPNDHGAEVLAKNIFQHILKYYPELEDNL